jgi:hypothetical protein
VAVLDAVIDVEALPRDLCCFGVVSVSVVGCVLCRGRREQQRQQRVVGACWGGGGRTPSTPSILRVTRRPFPSQTHQRDEAAENRSCNLQEREAGDAQHRGGRAAMLTRESALLCSLVSEHAHGAPRRTLQRSIQ